MVEQSQRGLVRPLQILDNEKQGGGPSRALQRGGHALEEIPTRLVWGQWQRRWGLRGDAAQARHEVRQRGSSPPPPPSGPFLGGGARKRRLDPFGKGESPARGLPPRAMA